MSDARPLRDWSWRQGLAAGLFALVWAGLAVPKSLYPAGGELLHFPYWALLGLVAGTVAASMWWVPRIEARFPGRVRVLRIGLLLAGTMAALPALLHYLVMDQAYWWGEIPPDDVMPVTAIADSFYLCGLALAMTTLVRWAREAFAWARRPAATPALALGLTWAALSLGTADDVLIAMEGLLANLAVCVGASAVALSELEEASPSRMGRLLVRLGALGIGLGTVAVSLLVIMPRVSADMSAHRFTSTVLLAAKAIMVLAPSGFGLLAAVIALTAADLLNVTFRRVQPRLFAMSLVAATVGFGLSKASAVDTSLTYIGQPVDPAKPTYLLELGPEANLLIAAAIAGAFAYLGTRRLSSSLRRTASGLATIRSGDLSVRLDESGNDEVSEVARSFNAMVAQLKEAQFLEKINVDLHARSGQLARTIEALRDAQADLVRSERMASVATMVKGIAHELNNPIGYIAANVAPLKRYCDFLARAATALADGRPRGEEERRALTQLSPSKDVVFVAQDLAKLTDDVAEGARRAQLIIADLQSLTSAAQRGIEQVDLHRAVRQTVSLLGPRLGHGVGIETELEEVPKVSARAGQLEQVLVNLVDNAIRAVGPSGRIHVSVARDGDGVVVTVRDNGAGMTEEVRRQACEPFFTTRAPGEGSGLGLAIVASVVRGHGGTLTIESAPGKGTAIAFRLPIAQDPIALAELGIGQETRESRV